MRSQLYRDVRGDARRAATGSMLLAHGYLADSLKGGTLRVTRMAVVD